MTKKEALKTLQAMRRSMGEIPPEFDDCKYITDTFDLAIKALMAYRDCRHCIHNVKMGNMRGCELWDCDFEEGKLDI